MQITEEDRKFCYAIWDQLYSKLPIGHVRAFNQKIFNIVDWAIENDYPIPLSEEHLCEAKLRFL